MNSDRILVVDDNPVNCLVAASLIRSFGYQADIASGGSEAIEAATHTQYCLILMDLQMPGMNGVESARALRRLLPSPPLILAWSASDPIDFPWNEVMDGFVEKPLTRKRLEGLLEYVFPKSPSRIPA